MPVDNNMPHGNHFASNGPRPDSVGSSANGNRHTPAPDTTEAFMMASRSGRTAKQAPAQPVASPGVGASMGGRSSHRQQSNTYQQQSRTYAAGRPADSVCAGTVAEQITSIDYDKDLAEALKNSYAIYSKEYAMQTASDDYENNKTNTLYAYQAAKIDRDAQKESTTASFRKLYTDLQEKQTALAAADADLAQAKKTFTVSQVQYTRGMISKMAYTDALDTFTTAQETEVAARIDLLTAYNTYQWAKRGVITATT